MFLLFEPEVLLRLIAVNVKHVRFLCGMLFLSLHILCPANVNCMVTAKTKKTKTKKKSGKVPPRFELGSLDSKSRVLTITPWDRHAAAQE